MPLDLPAGEFQAFIFDCDGTLADNMPQHFQAWSRAMRDFGGTYPEDLFYEWGGVPTAEIVRRLNVKFGTNLDVDTVVQRKEQYYLAMIPEVVPKTEVVEVVRANHGRKRLAVASGGHRELVVGTLGVLGILGLFDVVVTAEDYQHGKPHPEPFLTAARALGVAPETCLVFEDTASGAEAARAAGMRWILV